MPKDKNALTESDLSVIKKLKVGVWYDPDFLGNGEDVPYEINRPNFALRQLVKKGVMESKIVGEYPHKLKTIFKLLPVVLRFQNKEIEQPNEDGFQTKRNLEGCKKVSKVMESKGYNCVFERVEKKIDGQVAWILWIKLSEGTMVLTFVDRMGSILYYKCKEQFDFENLEK